MRKIDAIVIHCSATAEGRDYTVADIDRWHRARGFARIGYHYVVYRDGSYHRGRPDSVVGAHCPQESMNSRSVSICYVGGLASDGKTPRDTRTPQQKKTMVTLIRTLLGRYPEIKRVCGHRDVKGVIKACPCFDAEKEYAGLAPLPRHETADVGKIGVGILAAGIVAAGLFCGGCARKNVAVETPVTIEHSVKERDSLRIYAQKIDSVIVRDSIFLSERGDTVRLEVWRWRERLKIRTDTVIKMKSDTLVREVPVVTERRVEVPVEKRVEVKTPLKLWEKALMAMGGIALLTLIGVVVRAARTIFRPL